MKFGFRQSLPLSYNATSRKYKYSAVHFAFIDISASCVMSRDKAVMMHPSKLLTLGEGWGLISNMHRGVIIDDKLMPVYRDGCALLAWRRNDDELDVKVLKRCLNLECVHAAAFTKSHFFIVVGVDGQNQALMGHGLSIAPFARAFMAHYLSDFTDRFSGRPFHKESSDAYGDHHLSHAVNPIMLPIDLSMPYFVVIDNATILW